MSNMYTILENLKKATPQQQPQETSYAKPIYESVEARGSIVAGVKDVEQRLREQFTAMKEASYVHKGTYGTEYQGDADDADAPKRGRPAKGTARKEKVVQVKGPKGRPKKDPGASAPAKIGNDPFGRVPDKAPKGAKGTVIKGKATQDTNEDITGKKECPPMSHIKKMCKDGMSVAEICKMHPDCDRTELKQMVSDCKKQLEEAENPFASFKKQAKGAGLLRSKTKTKTMESSHRMAKLLIEGVNFTEMIKKKDMTLQEMLAELQQDIQSFKETGHCSELLRDCMEVHSYGKSQLNDATENPMDNDNFPMPLAPARPSMIDRAKRMGGQVLNTLGHGSDEDMKADLRQKMGMQEAAELNELARLAGLTVAESNDGNLANNAKPYGSVTQGDVVAGRLGNDAMGGNAEVDEGDMDEAANWRNPEYKDRLYTQELPDYENDDYSDDEYYNGAKPDDYAGSKNLIGGGEFDHNDPLQKGFGRHGHDTLDRGPRIGMPSRNHITSLKGSIKAAHGTHSEPNLPEGDMEEGAGVMHFKAQQAKADGKDSFKLGDEEFPVQEAGGERTMSRAAKGYEKYGKEGMEALAKAGREGKALDPIRAKYNKYDESMTEDDMEEGNEFSGNRDDAIKAGKTEFEVDGKTYPVKESSDDTCDKCDCDPCECDDADRELAKLKENCGIVSPIGSMAQDMQQQQGKMSINTTQSSDGTKNINISADGEAADQLMQMLKMAGMGGQHAEVVVTAQPMEAKQYGNTEVTEPEEVLNTPRPDVRGMHRAETVGYADTTDDLNKQKDQDPATANKAANPKTAKVNRVEESHPLEALGAKLMAEYQSIKLTK